MKKAAFSSRWFQGAVSVAGGVGGWQPWRLPVGRLDLFPAPNEALRATAADASGVRLRFQTDARALRLDYEPHGSVRLLDLACRNALLATVPLAPGSVSVRIESLPPGLNTLEIWLPHDAPIRIRALAYEGGHRCRAVPDSRPRWITYGSSITHCKRAHSPARTWPAIVARRLNLNLTSLGYGGQCHMDTMIAMMIRDMPARLVTLKLGINMMNGSYSARSFEPGIIGFVRILREGHPRIPIGLVSSICCPPREKTENAVGMTLEKMREAMVSAAGRLRGAGDRNLYDFNGLDVFDDTLIRRYSTDLCHPDGDGNERMGERFLTTVMAGLPVPRSGRISA